MDRLAAMETFVHVVESGSFSAAARRLNLGQPAVSKSIAQLEAYLQVRLLLRSTRGLSPTEAPTKAAPAGGRLFSCACAILRA